MMATANITIPEDAIRLAVRQALQAMAAEPLKFDSYVIRHENSTGRLLLEGPDGWFMSYPTNTPVSVGVIVAAIAEQSAKPEPGEEIKP